MKKITIISITALVLAACIAGFFVWKINDDKEKKELAVLADITSIQDQVNALYTDKQKTNLAATISNDAIQKTDDLFLAYKDKELSPQASELLNQASADLKDADRMFSLQQSIEQLFDENGAIVESADIASHKTQAEALKSDKPAFADELMITIHDAETQLEQISAATKMVDALFTSSEKSTVKKSISQKEIADAKANINNIKQDKAKTSLLSYIHVANQYLDAKLKAEAEAKAKAEAEAKAKAEAEAKAKAAAKKNSGKSPSSSNKSDSTIDLKDWVPYSTSDLSSLLKYLASGDVIEYNGQYYASPELFNMLSNEEVVYERDLSEE